MASTIPTTTTPAAPPSQTAQDFIAAQLRLEADAREALPYAFDACTQPLGPLRQSVYACLTCTPPPASQYEPHTPAGVCYSCSISCHGEHELVELFAKRGFVCDCGTARVGTGCALRMDGVVGEEARVGNVYNQNFGGRFCGCGEVYDAERERGTMFQCLGLGTGEQGGCGEDWWHPECLMGLPRRVEDEKKLDGQAEGGLESVVEEVGGGHAPTTNDGDAPHGEDHAVPAILDDTPPGFPSEDDFDHLICYKCVEAFPWIKQYAGTPGFLPVVYADGAALQENGHSTAVSSATTAPADSKKRGAEDDLEDTQGCKKVRTNIESTEHNTAPGVSAPLAAPDTTATNGRQPAPKHATLPPPSSRPITLFLKEDFRDHLCRCATCFPRLATHPQLLEEEDTYEPPLSESDAAEANNDHHPSAGNRSRASGSLLDRGEAALSSIDRVRAIEGVMAYNHVRDKVKAFLQPFAESGQAVGAEEIRAYFANLRGDEMGGGGAGVAAAGGDGEVRGDGRREPGGY